MPDTHKRTNKQCSSENLAPGLVAASSSWWENLAPPCSIGLLFSRLGKEVAISKMCPLCFAGHAVMLLRRIRSGWVSNSLFEVLHPVTTRMTFFLLGVSSSALPSCVSQALPALDGHEAILRGLSCIVQKGERAMLFVKELGYRAPELMNVMSVLFVCLFVLFVPCEAFWWWSH